LFGTSPGAIAAAYTGIRGKHRHLTGFLLLDQFLLTGQHCRADPVFAFAGLTLIKLQQGYFTGQRLLSSGKETFNPALQDRSSQHHRMLAFKAFNADIRPQSHYQPLIAGAGMRLFQPDHVSQSQFKNHNLILDHLMETVMGRPESSESTGVDCGIY
jgi:hypothetical protein